MKNKPTRTFYYFITDSDQMLFNCIGPISNDNELNKKVTEAIKAGRNLRAQSSPNSGDIETKKGFFVRKGFQYTSQLLVNEPADRSKEYIGHLPDYAKSADRKRVVKITCENCVKQRWAEMTVDYPGEEILNNSDVNQYEARCLKCGNIVYDSYNWGRY